MTSSTTSLHPKRRSPARAPPFIGDLIERHRVRTEAEAMRLLARGRQSPAGLAHGALSSRRATPSSRRLIRQNTTTTTTTTTATQATPRVAPRLGARRSGFLGALAPRRSGVTAVALRSNSARPTGATPGARGGGGHRARPVGRRPTALGAAARAAASHRDGRNAGVGGTTAGDDFKMNYAHRGRHAASRRSPPPPAHEPEAAISETRSSSPRAG